MAAEPVFIDTVAFLAMVVDTDALHTAAMGVMESILRERSVAVTSDLVLVEFLNGSSRPPRRKAAAGFVRGLLANPRVRVEPMDHGLLLAALGLFESRPDKEWSLVDCASMLICRREGISRVFTRDHHFRQAGFEILL